jgi:hypothetical protein
MYITNPNIRLGIVHCYDVLATHNDSKVGSTPKHCLILV